MKNKDFYDLNRLFFLEKMTKKQVADLLEISEETVIRIVKKGLIQEDQGFIKKENLIKYLVNREFVNLPILSEEYENLSQEKNKKWNYKNPFTSPVQWLE